MKFIYLSFIEVQATLGRAQSKWAPKGFMLTLLVNIGNIKFIVSVKLKQ